MRILSRSLSASLLLAAALAASPAFAQFVPITATPTVQTFDSLANTGTSATLPDGWYLLETGTNANTTYLADNGTSASGNTFSYGASGSTERALGELLSGSLVPIIGAQLRNETGASLTEIAVTFTGEQWRLGTAGRVDRLDAQYSLNATSLGDTGATWVNVDLLDFSSPTSTGTLGALDGNLAANRTLVSDSIVGLNLAPSASLWVRWVDFNATGADDGLAIDDISFASAGGPPIDVPPTVTSTTPSAGATNVALASTIAVNFSEPVTLASTWFTLSCSISGSHTGSTTGGPSSYVLTPSPGFSAAENCTFTVLASAVTDLDGTPDPMAADKVVMFSTLDPNAPPTVVSITPANGASNVPTAADIRVVFSEAVTTTSGAFALACNSTAIALGESGTGANRTLTPATLLPGGASCVFTITGSAVRNGNNIALASNPTSTFTVFAPTPVGAYYNGVDTSSPQRLMCTLHVKILGHTAYPYSGGATDTWKILEIADASPSDPNKILDVYRNRLYNAVSDRAGTGAGITYNREHTWPNSLGFPGTTGNLGMPSAPYTDTHMLHLSDTSYNATRGNFPYKNCAAPLSCAEGVTEVNAGFGGGSGVYPGNSNWSTNSGYEVWGHQKGDMARAVMYMAVRYQGGVDPTSGQNEPILRLTDNTALVVGQNNYSQPAYMGVMADLIAWSQADPPDAAEMARNGVIQTFQGNRNPFIDHPEWATSALFNANYVAPAGCPLLSADVIFANGFDSAPPAIH